MVRAATVILSICPPHAALDVARQVAAAGYGGIYVDANAVSVATATQVASVVEAGGARYVDGGIIGLPPEAAGNTRLYLSGPLAGEVRALFGRSALDARIADGPAFAASAVKMAYAAWTKGTGALLLAVRALARAEGVERTLLAEWAMSQPALGKQSERSAAAAAAKGWRWVAEMEEIAASMAAAGLPAGFHEAAAEVFDRAAKAERRTRGPAANGPAGADSALDDVVIDPALDASAESRAVGRRPGTQPGQPGGHRSPVLPVLGAEFPGEPRLLVPAHGGGPDAPRDQRVLQEPGGAEEQRLAEQDAQEADVDGVAHVPVAPAHHETGRGRRRHGGAVGPEELDERVHHRDEARADQQDARRPRDPPVRQRPVKMPVVQQVRQQAAERPAHRHEPRHADRRRH